MTKRISFKSRLLHKSVLTHSQLVLFKSSFAQGRVARVPAQAALVLCASSGSPSWPMPRLGFEEPVWRSAQSATQDSVPRSMKHMIILGHSYAFVQRTEN